MKKAKIFLTALTVLAVVGGALAFKAKVPRRFAICDPINLVCVISPFETFQQTTSNGGFLVSYGEFGSNCVNINGQWVCTARVTFSA